MVKQISVACVKNKKKVNTFLQGILKVHHLHDTCVHLSTRAYFARTVRHIRATTFQIFARINSSDDYLSEGYFHEFK